VKQKNRSIVVSDSLTGGEEQMSQRTRREDPGDLGMPSERVHTPKEEVGKGGAKSGQSRMTRSLGVLMGVGLEKKMGGARTQRREGRLRNRKRVTRCCPKGVTIG